MINDHFNTLNYDDISFGYTGNDSLKPTLAKVLHGTEDDRWESKHELKQLELPQLLAFWNIFLSFSLLPTLHRTILGEVRASILYCFLAETRIDIGQVIHNAIIDAGRINVRPDAKLKPIIFPSLITALLKKDGVPELNTDEISVVGSDLEDIDAKFNFELGSDDETDEDYKGVSKLDQVLSTVKEIIEGTEFLHKRMDLFEAELRHQGDDAADIRKELCLRLYHRRRPASSV
ncbi:hypothetical protein LWI28_010253 [Acer negundo]|uniref:Putative plant transposon protein domain-containing protein n=1 Tax=Acer negundo TaxID=4023 RepID=A0AAD5P6X8_ACENE|nr:hypothetical protein LWI28_010253 [Acer negundo]